MAGAQTVLDLPYRTTTAVVRARFVKGTGNELIGAVTASTDRPVGVSTVDVSAAEQAQGKGCSVKTLGVAWVEAGAAVTAFGRVMADTVGRAVNAATAGNVPCGVALKGAAGAGELIPVLLTPGMPVI